MSVATQLGLADPDSDLLGLARHRWHRWGEAFPVLGVVDDLLELPGWLNDAGPEQSDGVLLALARLASPSGGDDVAATGALVWVLLPGASLLAHRLRTLTPRIDEVVAAQLWVEARTFPWERGRKVAANILMNTRKGVLRDLDVGEPLRRADPAWARAVVVAPDADLWGFLDARQTGPVPATAAAELEEVFEQAVRAGVVSVSDCDLLLGLADAADRTGRGARRGQGGLTARAASETVAQQWGLSARTVRRRASRSLCALSEACAQPGIPA